MQYVRVIKSDVVKHIGIVWMDDQIMSSEATDGSSNRSSLVSR